MGSVSFAVADRRTRDAAVPPSSVGSVLARGVGAAIWVCLASFGVVAAPVLIAWMGAGADEPMAEVLAFAVVGVLVGLGSTLWMPDASFDLTPLGLTVVILALAYRGGLWAAEGVRPATGTRVGTLLASTTIAAAALAGMAAAVVSNETLGIDPGDAATQAGLVVLTGTALGALGVRSSWRDDMLRRVPGLLAASLRPALAALGVLLACAAALTTVALAASFGTITALLDQLDPGAAGLLALLLGCLAYLPTLLAWVLAVAVGPGVSVGSVVDVSGGGVESGPLPGFPLLAVVPDTMPAWLAPLGISSLVAAGIVASLVAYRARHSRAPARLVSLDGDAADAARPAWWESAATAGLSGLVAGLAVAFVSWSASGSMGPGDLAWAGVEPSVGGIVGVVVASSAAATAGALDWRRSRQSPSRDASASLSAS